MAKSKRECAECGKLRVITARELCGTCYGKPEVRAKYPPKRKGVKPGSTMPDFEAIDGYEAGDVVRQASRLPELIKVLVEELLALSEQTTRQADECIGIVEGYADRVHELREAYIRLRDRAGKVGERFGGLVVVEGEEGEE